MRSLLLALTLAALHLGAHGQLATPEFERLELSTHVELRATYAGEAVRIADPKRVRLLVREVKPLGLRTWAPTTTVKHGRCTAQVTFYRNGERVLHLFVSGQKLYRRERELGAKMTQVVLAVEPTEIGSLAEALTNLDRPSKCNK